MSTPPDLLRVMTARVDEIYMEVGCLERRRKEQDKSLEEIKALALGLAAQLRTLEARARKTP